ncbi:uncharacterized protein V1516DRAFT_697440 [Lipomyces oligophaga]|uniref:uncharacterized protein n=1 Tax=Lipomyces oligophaga TaxID=45792 RepID=UPI0034CE7D55
MAGKRKSTTCQGPQKRAKSDHIKPDQQESDKPERKNTAVYITGLPTDVTQDELEKTFSRYGLIAEDLTTGQKRIKLYLNDNEEPKGDALIVFFKAESVSLAVDMMDDAPFRVGGNSDIIRVQPADMNYKVEKEAKPIQQRSMKERQEIQRRAQKMNNKLADWDDADLELIQQQQRQSTALRKFNKIVIIKHAFTLDELKTDITAAIDIKQDIREGCEDIGPVTSIVLYDLEPDGVLSVRFQREQDAFECVNLMDGRYFGGRPLSVQLYDGLTRYRKTSKRTAVEEGDNEDERLRKFGEWLESGAANEADEGEWSN